MYVEGKANWTDRWFNVKYMWDMGSHVVFELRNWWDGVTTRWGKTLGGTFGTSIILVLAAFISVCLLGIQVGLLSRKLDIQVWSSVSLNKSV